VRDKGWGRYRQKSRQSRHLASFLRRLSLECEHNSRRRNDGCVCNEHTHLGLRRRRRGTWSSLNYIGCRRSHSDSLSRYEEDRGTNGDGLLNHPTSSRHDNYRLRLRGVASGGGTESAREMRQFGLTFSEVGFIYACGHVLGCGTDEDVDERRRWIYSVCTYNAQPVS